MGWLKKLWHSGYFKKVKFKHEIWKYIWASHLEKVMSEEEFREVFGLDNFEECKRMLEKIARKYEWFNWRRAASIWKLLRTTTQNWGRIHKRRVGFIKRCGEALLENFGDEIIRIVVHGKIVKNKELFYDDVDLIIVHRQHGKKSVCREIKTLCHKIAEKILSKKEDDKLDLTCTNTKEYAEMEESLRSQGKFFKEFYKANL